MNKLLIINLLIITLLLTGCGIFDLTSWVMPDDLEFLALVESLDTPRKICQYMSENFTYKLHTFYAPDPYTFWKLKEGDCNDFSCFAVFVAHWHGYETYQIRVSTTFKYDHMLGVFVENGYYTFSSNVDYYPWLNNSFKDVIRCHTNNCQFYKVYDYDMNLIEEGYM